MSKREGVVVITYLRVTEDFELVPDDDEGIKYVYNRKAGDILKCDIKIVRNYKFHKKLMSLFKMIHDYFPEPEPIMFRGKMVKPEHTFDMTRKYLTVKAGFYDVIGTPDGGVRVEARSLKFNKMTETEFSELYSKVIDASLKALPESWSDEERDRVANEIVNYV